MTGRADGEHHAAALIGRRHWLPWVAATAVLLLGVVGSLAGASFYSVQVQAQARAAADTDARRGADHVSSVLTNMGSFAQALRVLIVTDRDGVHATELQSFMDGLYAQWGGLRSVAAAPGNRVAAVAPLAGNESVLGLNYPDNPEQWPPIRDAIRSGEPVLIGPVALVQGGSGFIYRVPVFLREGEYWGVVSAVVDAQVLAPTPGNGPAFALRDHATPGFPIIGSPSAFTGDPATARVTALGRQWDIAVPVTADDRAGRTAILLFGLLISVLLAILVFLLVRARSRERALARLMRELSGQAPGVLFQLRQRPDGTRELTYLSAGGPSPLTQAVTGHRDDIARLAELIHPDDRHAVAQALDVSARTVEPWHQRFRVQPPAQPVAWLLADARPQVQRNQDIVWHGWVSDITEDLRDEEALRVSASLFQVTHDGVAILDASGRITDVNAGLEAISGFDRDDLVRTPFADYCMGLTPGSVLEDMWHHLEQHGYWRGEITGRRHDGTSRSETTTAIAVRDPRGHLSHYIIVLDNTNLTRDDPITGLPHPRLLDEEVRQARAGGAGPRSALVVIGLDRFRHVNDAYGHRVGDQLLRAVADRLVATLPRGCTLARLRGDEFAFAVTKADDLAHVEALARTALDAIAPSVTLSGHDVRVTAAAGISLSPDDAGGVAEMHVHANQAMRDAKATGPGLLSFFDTDMHKALEERGRLTEDLLAALGTDQLYMAFQPIIDLRTGSIARAEALMRWDHPDLGPIAPDRFIPLAEQSGMMVDLTDVAFTRTIEALTTIRGISPDFQVSVNLSPAELHADTHRHLQRIDTIAQRGLPGTAIIVEITEGVLLSGDPVVDTNLGAYRAAGLRFAIDDFGTGYSSLAYLQRLDVDFLKIDRSFIHALAPANDGLALCEAIIEMAHKMGITVIAEGVETELQNTLLAVAGCDHAQGFLHARPMPLNELMAHIASTQARM